MIQAELGSAQRQRRRQARGERDDGASIRHASEATREAADVTAGAILGVSLAPSALPFVILGVIFFGTIAASVTWWQWRRFSEEQSDGTQQ